MITCLYNVLFTASISDYCDLKVKRNTNCHFVLNKINKLEKKNKLVLAHLIVLEHFCSSSARIFSFALPNSWSFSCTNELTASFGGTSLAGFTFPNWRVSLWNSWNSTLDAWKRDTNNTISFQCNFHLCNRGNFPLTLLTLFPGSIKLSI